MAINFAEIQNIVTNSPGLYVIYTNHGIPLKCGISVKLLKRLKDHRASCQSGLKKQDGETVNPDDNLNPDDVRSKKSILAKHLFFDEEITDLYNLKTQKGRRDFLLYECYIEFEYTKTKEIARDLEIELESKSIFRYQGMVQRYSGDLP